MVEASSRGRWCLQLPSHELALPGTPAPHTWMTTGAATDHKHTPSSHPSTGGWGTMCGETIPAIISPGVPHSSNALCSAQGCRQGNGRPAGALTQEVKTASHPPPTHTHRAKVEIVSASTRNKAHHRGICFLAVNKIKYSHPHGILIHPHHITEGGNTGLCRAP